MSQLDHQIETGEAEASYAAQHDPGRDHRRERVGKRHGSRHRDHCCKGANVSCAQDQIRREQAAADEADIIG